MRVSWNSNITRTSAVTARGVLFSIKEWLDSLVWILDSGCSVITHRRRRRVHIHYFMKCGRQPIFSNTFMNKCWWTSVDLGFIFDSDMSFSEQINSVSKSCHFHIRDIRRIRNLLPLSAVTALANSLVSSKLDYCNSLNSGISQSNLNKLQRIQNSLARVITNTSKYQHITPTLKKLHWLPIKQRIDYKLCLLTYKTLTNQQPTYLYNSLSFPSHSVSTRSSDSLVLSIPYVRSSLGKRAFSVICPRLWNSLPPDNRNSNSLPTFRSRLKTHLFKIAFPL